MILENLFNKDITRPIDGVIKADDNQKIATEVSEYVITKEVEGKLSQHFLEKYNEDYSVTDPTTNGVWISGFFGSGKSHLLKMLSLLLENPEVDGKRVSAYFDGKVKDNAILESDLRIAASKPSKSILFNIDAKADVVSKDQADAVLSVFMKVFDEMQGFYAKHGYMAELERAMQKEGIYEDFKAKFEEVNGKTWKERRGNLLLVKGEFAKAYVALRGGELADAKQLITDYRDNYTLSIESFADRVFEYIEAQNDPKFRLNFFVDEVGQYISDNVKLMTNLQTIAESLLTRCKGRAWVFVTSQEDMSKVIKGLKDKQGNDFSKIQGRFGCKLNLSSQNVDEVIQRRLLEKNKAGIQVLKPLFKEHGQNFATLFRFHEGGTDYPVIQNEDDFILLYPFQRYHFDLLQDCIRELSGHNAFSGKHTSVGERSMLSVFQEVVKGMIADGMEIGTLPTFDRMYEGLKPILQSGIRVGITRAEKNLGKTAYTTRLLKALFMVKYVKNFVPTANHLAVLMQDRFDADPKAHLQQVKTALNQLEHGVYIQRNGNRYEFLTSAEKDIENDIKNTNVDATEEGKFLAKTIFGDIIGLDSVEYGQGNQSFRFNELIDGAPHGRQTHELALHVITERHESYRSPDNLIAQTSGLAEVRFILPADAQVFDDIRLILQTDIYVARNGNAPPDKKPLIMMRGHENTARRQAVIARLRQMMTEATPVAYGSELKNVGGGDPKNRVAEALRELIVLVYPSLRLLGTHLRESDLTAVLTMPPANLLSEAENTLGSAESEVLDFVTLQHKTHARPTAKSLTEHFGRKPFGWSTMSTLTLIGRLVAYQRLELLMDGEEKNDNREILAILKNSQRLAAAQLRPLSKVDQKKVKALRTLHKTLFLVTNPGREAKDTGMAFKAALENELQDVRTLIGDSSRLRQYPFLANLKPYLDKLKHYAEQKYQTYFEEIKALDADLFDLREDLYGPIKEFFGSEKDRGEKAEIYDAVREYLDRMEENYRHLDPELIKPLQQLLENKAPYRGNAIREARTHLDSAKAAAIALVKNEQAQAIAVVRAGAESLRSAKQYLHLTETEQRNQAEVIDRVVRELEGMHKVGRLRERLRRFNNEDHLRLLNDMASTVNQRLNPPAPPTDTAPATAPTNYDVPPSKGSMTANESPGGYQDIPTVISVRQQYGSPYIETEAEMEAFLATYRKMIKKIIDDGDTVRIF